MCQPLAYHTPDAGRQGFIDLPEFPFSLEPRVCTRWDIHRYARQAYDLGVRYDKTTITMVFFMVTKLEINMVKVSHFSKLGWLSLLDTPALA
jgi:hypothetical protein